MNGWTIATIVVNAVLLGYCVVMLVIGHIAKKKRISKAKKELSEDKENE